MNQQRDDVLALFSVSRETAERLDSVQRELVRWQTIKNLVAPSTLDEIWFRHIADSLQLAELVKSESANRSGADFNSGSVLGLTIADLGSGAGFPGLILGIVGIELGWKVHLIESNARKCAFLRHVSRETGAATEIHPTRIEDIVPSLVGKVQVVTARALASLSQLFAYSESLLTSGAIGLFPKGRQVQEELTEAQKSWKFTHRLVPSKTDSEARIIVAHMI